MPNYNKPTSYTYQGTEDGPKLLIFGAIHGDEICGPKAINRLMNEIDSGKLEIQRGVLTCVPISNPEAYRQNVRFVEDNLNRVFKKWDSPDSYEKKLANDLIGYVDTCDIFLDLHSMPSSGAVTVFVDFPTADNRRFARVLGAEFSLLGWPELYDKSDSGIVSYDTTAYANSRGKTGLLLECGRHDDSEAVNIGYNAIISTLRYAGLIDGKPEESDPKEVFMKELYVKQNENDKLARDWNHLDEFKEGDIVAYSETEGEIKAPFDGVILLPRNNHPVGTEWFYLGAFK